MSLGEQLWKDQAKTVHELTAKDQSQNHNSTLSKLRLCKLTERDAMTQMETFKAGVNKLSELGDTKPGSTADEDDGDSEVKDKSGGLCVGNESEWAKGEINKRINKSSGLSCKGSVFGGSVRSFAITRAGINIGGDATLKNVTMTPKNSPRKSDVAEDFMQVDEVDNDSDQESVITTEALRKKGPNDAIGWMNETSLDLVIAGRNRGVWARFAYQYLGTLDNNSGEYFLLKEHMELYELGVALMLQPPKDKSFQKTRDEDFTNIMTS